MTGMSGLVVILEDISLLFSESSSLNSGDGGLDLRWAKTAFLNDLIQWCKTNVAAVEHYSEFVSILKGITNSTDKIGKA